MNVPPNISKNRLKFTDEENKVLVKDFSTLVDSAPLNDALPALGENALVAASSATEAMGKLKAPLSKVTETLNSGGAASEMLTSIQKTVSSTLPEMRAINATITSIAASGQGYSDQLTKSVMGSLNTAMAQVPGVLGKIEKLSSGVKASLLKTSVGDFASSLTAKAKDWGSTASNLLSSAGSLQVGVAQAASSITAAKQGFAQANQIFSQGSLSSKLSFTQSSLAQVSQAFGPQGSVTQTLKGLNLSEINTQALSNRITQALSKEPVKPTSEVGTTSALLDVSGNTTVRPDTSPASEIDYSDTAVTLLFAGMTWYRSLYTCEYAPWRLEALVQNFGASADHYAVLTQTPTDLQFEQLRNFEALIGSNTPDNPSKNLFVYDCYQGVMTLLLTDLPSITEPVKLQAVLAYLGQSLFACPIKALMASKDYDSLAASVQSIVYSAQTNSYAIDPLTEYLVTYKESLAQLITDAVVYHRGSVSEISKRSEASSEIAVFCSVWVMRSYLQAYLNTSDAQQRVQLVLAMQAVNSVELRTLTYLYTDFHALVREEEWVYWRPSTRAVYEVTYPLLRYYLLHRKPILQAREYLSTPEEKTVFDALTLRLEGLVDSGIAEIKQLQDDTSSFMLGSLTEVQVQAGADLISAITLSRQIVLEASGFAEQAFEMYYVTPDHLYFDEAVAFMR